MLPDAAARPPPAPPPPSRPPFVLAGLGVLAVVALVVAVLGYVSGGDGDGPTSAGESRGSALGSVAGGSTVRGNVGTAAQETTTVATGPRPDLPPVTIPTESSPPTTIPGSDPSSVPGADGDLPLFAHLVVELDPGGYQDFAVYLRQDQEFQLLSLADDGIQTHIEVFAPDGSSEGSWDGGEPGVVNGLEWFGDEQLPASGTYVIRVTHTGGREDRFVLGFFGDA